MPTSFTYPSVQDYTDKQIKAISRIHETIFKGEERLGDHYRKARSYARQFCHNVVELRIIKEDQSPVVFNAYMCDVSLSGMSFIFPEKIEETQLIIGIPIPGRDITWYNGEIVRKRLFSDEDFWDYGVQFKGKFSQI